MYNANVWAINDVSRGARNHHTPSTSSSDNIVDNSPLFSNSQYSDSIYNSHVQSFKAICSHLSTGPENPEIFVYMYNLLLSHHGYPSVSVPESIILASKEVTRNNPTHTPPSQSLFTLTQSSSQSQSPSAPDSQPPSAPTPPSQSPTTPGSTTHPLPAPTPSPLDTPATHPFPTPISSPNDTPPT